MAMLMLVMTSVMLLIMLVMQLPLMAADDVVPASCTTTNYREEAVANIDSVTYYQGSTIRFTNCVLYASTGTNTVQGLDGVTVTISVGTTSSNIDYNATIQDAAAGKWAADVTVPDWATIPAMQVKIEDGNTNTYIYPWKTIKTKAAL